MKNLPIVLAVLCSLATACGHQAAGETPPATEGKVQASPGSPPSPAAPPGPGMVFDLGRDFSLTANPNGPWTYGYTRGTKLAPADVSPDKVTETLGELGFWHPRAGAPGYYP